MEHDAEASRVLRLAYDVSRKLSDASTRARAACAYASALENSAGQHERAEGLFNSGIADLPDEPQFAADRIACLLRGSEIARSAGDFTRGLQRALAAHALLPQMPYPSRFLEMRVVMDLAEAYRTAAQYPAAIANFDVAYSLMVALGRENTRNAVAIYNNWALALAITGQTLKAQELMQRAVRLSRDESGDNNVSPMLLTNLARLLIELEQVAEGARLADQAYERARIAGDENAVRDSTLVRALAQRRLGAYGKAQTLLNEADSRFRKSYPPDCICFASVAFERAALAQAQGEVRAAIVWADNGMAIAEADSIHREALPHFLRRRADLELDQNRYDAARADAAKAAQLYLEAVPPQTASSHLGLAYLALGRSLLATGRTSEAREALTFAAKHLQPSLGADHPQTRTAARLLTTTFAASNR